MKYWQIKVLEFTFLYIMTAILWKGIQVAFSNEPLLEFNWVDHFIYPFILNFVLFITAGIGREKSYYLESGQLQEILQKLYSIGYIPTTDPGPKFFFKRRKFFGLKTARIDVQDTHVILYIMEKISEFEDTDMS